MCPNVRVSLHGLKGCQSLASAVGEDHVHLYFNFDFERPVGVNEAMRHCDHPCRALYVTESSTSNESIQQNSLSYHYV